jgi:hypothetical protein
MLHTYSTACSILLSSECDLTRLVMLLMYEACCHYNVLLGMNVRCCCLMSALSLVSLCSPRAESAGTKPCIAELV